MRLPTSSGGAAPSIGRGRGAAASCRRGPATSGGRGGAGRCSGRGATTAYGGRGGSLRVRGARESRGGETASSTTSVPGARADPADDDYDPELEDVEADDLWVRGPTGLPPVPTREDEKIVLTPYGDTQWGEQQEESRLPNGILGVLIREAFPGKVTYKGNDEPAWTWQHYNLAEDISDGDAQFHTALERVEESFWWWFKWANGKELQARRVVRNVVKKLIPQMFYEGRIQSVIIYYNRVLGRKIHKKEACKIDLTVEQYMEAIPWWAQKAPHAWKLAAELKWCNEAWKIKSLAAKARRAKMGGVSHRQGSCSHARYKKKLEVKHKRPISDIEAYAMARRGDQEGTFCNQKTADKIEAYKVAAAEMHGLEFDVMNASLDNIAVYKAGHRKKHGRYLIGDGFISTPSTLSEVQASQDGVCPQRRRRTDVGDGVLEQEIEKRKILEAKLDKQSEISRCLQDGYNTLAMIIQTQLKVPIPPLVLPQQTDSSHQGTSGGSNTCHSMNDAGRGQVGEVNPIEDDAHQSIPPGAI